MRVRRLIPLVAALVVVAACAETDQGVSSTRSREVGAPLNTDPEVPLNTDPEVPLDTDPDNPLDPPVDTTPPPADGGIIDFGDAKTPQSYDNFLNAAFTDVTEFWAENFPALYGAEFQPVAGIYALYPERGDLPESCQGPVPYEAVEGNAFYTTCGDIILYDDSFLLPDLVAKLGESAVGVVAAHEYGHAIQGRVGLLDAGLPTVDTEQQADCFAGAWAARAARGESERMQFDDADVKSGLIAMIEVRDPPGFDSAGDASGHGNAFDRVGAFQEGFINGVTRCADFINNPNPRIDLVFQTEEEFETGGNLPFDEILAALPLSLDTFWVPTLEASAIPFTPPTQEAFPTDGPFPTCDGQSGEQLKHAATFCTSTNTIVYDDNFLQDLFNRLGDVSFSYPIAGAYSDAVQVALSSTLAGEPRVLLNDCLVGAWLVDIVPNPNVEPGVIEPNNPNQEIVLSAGDLDEVVLTAVITGDEASDTNVVGTAFEKIDAFRAGVLGGMNGCQSRIG